MIKDVFPAFEKELCAEIEKVSTRRFYKAGESIIKKGDPLHFTYLLLNGCAKMCHEGKNKNELIIGYISAGDSFAVSVSDDQSPQDKMALLTFTAVENTEILKLPFSAKDSLAKKYSSWYQYILRMSVKYSRSYLEVIDNIALGKNENKVEYFLSRLSSSKNTNTLQVTHQEIANGINTSREVVSRILKKMEDKGKILMQHNKIKILIKL